jgi:hypothetical protein
MLTSGSANHLVTISGFMYSHYLNDMLLKAEHCDAEIFHVMSFTSIKFEELG